MKKKRKKKITFDVDIQVRPCTASFYLVLYLSALSAFNESLPRAEAIVIKSCNQYS